MTSKDKHIWDQYTRGLKPVAKKKPKPVIAKSSPEKTAARAAAVREPAPTPKTSSGPVGETAQQLERKREKLLKQGDVAIDAKLDLHGMTQDEAFAALAAFMQRAVKTQKRHLLIVTGKGRGGMGVLRTNLASWLAQLPQASAILAIRPASIKHGGDGAFYVVMRRVTPPATHA